METLLFSCRDIYAELAAVIGSTGKGRVRVLRGHMMAGQSETKKKREQCNDMGK